MRANPGGHIAPSETIGRDTVIQRLWQILERQSLLLNAERRMGKTCVIKKMNAEPAPGVLPIYRDLEGIRRPIEFVETIFQDVHDHLGSWTRLLVRARELLTQLDGMELGGIIKLPRTAAPHWKAVLLQITEALVEHQQDQRVVFLWDELPLMLYNIKQQQAEATAMELLDALRQLRQTAPALRMVYTGSLGLHHVVGSLKASGYANDPTNDMYTLLLPPLTPGDATDLAGRLLVGEQVATLMPVVAEAVAEAVEGQPFYIHQVVDDLASLSRPVGPGDVASVVGRSLTDPVDRWHLQHYRERLDIYFQPEQVPTALALLDTLAGVERSMALKDLRPRVAAELGRDDPEELRAMLQLLQRDHYLTQEADGGFRFRSSLIEAWWRLHRGLADDGE